MPRPLIYSNGSLFLGIDDRFRIRDLFFPHVGLFNHLSGHAIRMGIWVDGAFTWVDDDGWNRELSYEPGTLIGRAVLRHPAFGIQIECRDAVHPRLNAFCRAVTLQSTHGSERDVRMFFTHDLRIAETDIGDTALFNPFLNGLVHYKGPHWFLFTARSESLSALEYATGIKGFGGMEGTWRDAEDGRLGMNPIAQGSVDSTMGQRLALNSEGRAELVYEILAADSLNGLERLRQEVSQEHSLEVAELARNRDTDHTSALARRLDGLPDEVVELCRRSLLILLAHCDHDGAILAAVDSDIMETNRANYCYCWPRDGAHICLVLDRLGIHEPARRFFRFCKRTLSLEHPILLQKYRPDGALGATWHPWVVDGQPEVPFQEDESASVLHALGEHFKHTDDLLLLDELFASVVVPMANYLAEFRDLETGLPKPSYDLWEERRGVHAYTAAAVYAGLMSAHEMADKLQDPRAFDYREAADEVRRGVLEHLARNEGGFKRSLCEPDVADASTLHLGLYGLIDPTSDAFARQVELVADRLTVRSSVGGLARYQSDYYFRVSDDFCGNPWIICTMWLAQCQIARAASAEDLEEPLEALRWAARHAESTQALPEQLHPYTGGPLSVSPLAWSHSEVLKTALDWSEKRVGL